MSSVIFNTAAALQEDLAGEDPRTLWTEFSKKALGSLKTRPRQHMKRQQAVSALSRELRKDNDERQQ